MPTDRCSPSRSNTAERGPTKVRRVLVVGAGVAGSTAAYWLGRYGFDVTVVEQAQGQRSSGSPVDVRGLATPVVEQMNLLPALRAAATAATTLAVVDDQGERLGWIPTQAHPDGLEIPRSDLAAILAAAAREHAQFIYGDTVTAVHDDGHGVDVTFRRGPLLRFDLVVGADGLHSRVRRLAFSSESSSITHLGLYIATTTLDHPGVDPSTVIMHNTPGRAVAVHPTVGRECAAFIFRHPRVAETTLRDPSAHRQLVIDAYSGMGWRTPELLDRVRDADDLYFDAVSRVRLDTWSRNRIMVVGDAAGCVSLFGEGSSMAIVGAATLAQALAKSPGDPGGALRCYEDVHRHRSASYQRGATTTSHLLVPVTRVGLAARNAAFRLWPAFTTT